MDNIEVNDILKFGKEYYQVERICEECILKAEYNDETDEVMPSKCISAIQLTGDIEDENSDYLCECGLKLNGKRVWFTLNEYHTEYQSSIVNLGKNPLIEREIL